MPTFNQLEYDGELTDEDPMVAILISRRFLPYLLGACERLTYPETWSPDADKDAAMFQSLDAIVRLLGTDVPEVTAYPWSITVAILATNVITAGGFNLYLIESQFYGGFYYNAVPVLNESIVEFTVALGAGDYYIRTFCRTLTNRGKFRWSINGVDINSAYDMDMYSGTVQYNVVKACPFSIADEGEKHFVLRNVGKNALATNYYIDVTLFTILRYA